MMVLLESYWEKTGKERGKWEWEEEDSTDAAWKSLLVVNVPLHPRHQVLDVFGRRHLGRTFILLRVLP